MPPEMRPPAEDRAFPRAMMAEPYLLRGGLIKRKPAALKRVQKDVVVVE